MKEIVILGGPNGAGKTTVARVLLPQFFRSQEFAYLNADEIAREISPQNVDAAAFAAGRRMIGRMQELVSRGMSFAFETTCAGKTYLPMLEQCKREGWRLTLIYLWLPSPDSAVGRVRRRVAHGGHGIPEKTIVRRFFAGLRNMLEFYLPLAETAAIYDNGGMERVLVVDRDSGSPFTIRDAERWARLKDMASWR